MIRGMWRQHEASDGTYTFHDLMDINLILDMMDENTARAQEAAERDRPRR